MPIYYNSTDYCPICNNIFISTTTDILNQVLKRDKVLNKITALYKDQNSWKNEDDILQLFRSNFKGNRFFLKGKVTLHTLSLFFDSDLKLVKKNITYQIQQLKWCW